MSNKQSDRSGSSVRRPATHPGRSSRLDVLQEEDVVVVVVVDAAEVLGDQVRPGDDGAARRTRLPDPQVVSADGGRAARRPVDLVGVELRVTELVVDLQPGRGAEREGRGAPVPARV